MFLFMWFVYVVVCDRYGSNAVLGLELERIRFQKAARDNHGAPLFANE